MLIGESPGESENMLGEPFAGEAGRLLNQLIKICLTQTCRLATLDETDGTDYDLVYEPGMSIIDGIDKVITHHKHIATDFIAEVHKAYPSPKVGVTNILACIPWKIEKFVKSGVRPPTKIEALSCRPRLLDILTIAQPKGIICLGREAARFLPKPKEGLPDSVKFVEEVVHPSAILRLLRDDPVRHAEVRNRTILTMVRAKRKLWGLDND